MVVGPSVEILIGIFVSLAAGVLLSSISRKLSYALGVIGSFLGAALSLIVLLSGNSLTIQLWEMAPNNFLQLVLSPFSSFFLLISSLVWLGACLYSLRYDDDYSAGLSSLFLLTMLSMFVILVSGDAITFLIGWEAMTLASFFMILQGKGSREGVRNAAFLFLAFGEASSVFIMLAFSGLFSSVGNFSFLGATPISVVGPIASWVFVTALIGFGLKMGIAPFHMSEWLPIAHSSAPSNASALLSATLTLMGVYGLINVISQLGEIQLWWGWLALVIGGISALLGALFASVSEHSKGLPAYSTIENNGLIVLAIGAYLVASYYNLTLLADLAIIAALFHAFAHSIAKASLFLINGWISKIKQSFDLNSSHSILRRDSGSVSFAGIFTVLSLAAAPPLAGFVSEWMILEVLFQSFRFGDVVSQIIGTLVGAVTALAAGIIIIAMTKVYGFGMLRSVSNENADGSKSSVAKTIPIKASFVYLLALVIGVGVAAPGIFFLASNAVFQLLHSYAFGSFVTGALGVPAYFVILSGNPFGGFSPTFTAIFMVALLAVPLLIFRLGGRWHVRRSVGWFSGAAQPDSAAEQYNSFGYSTPMRIMMRFFFRTKERIVHVGAIRRAVILSPEEYVVELEVLDAFKRFYDVLAKWTTSLSSYVARKVMTGRLSAYLIYMMAAWIIVLLYILLTIL
jgi:hydrogenase-4 component B